MDHSTSMTSAIIKDTGEFVYGSELKEMAKQKSIFISAINFVCPVKQCNRIATPYS